MFAWCWILGCGLLGTWRAPTAAEEAVLLDVGDLPVEVPARWRVDVLNGRETEGHVLVWRTRHGDSLRVEAEVGVYASEAGAAADASWSGGRAGFEIAADVGLMPQGPFPGLEQSAWYVGEGADEAFWVEGRRGRALFRAAAAGVEPKDLEELTTWIGHRVEALDALSQ